MCDIQIFTGISVLISGFVLLFKELQAYHWQLIVYIAWFSSTTHISAMTVLRSYLRERRVETSVRFGLMLCLLIMLIIAFIPTAFFDWANSYMSRCSVAKASSPALCFFDIPNARKLSTDLNLVNCGSMTPPSNPAGQSMVLSLVLLIFGFVSRSVKLFEPLYKTVHVYIRRPMSKRAQQVFIWLFESPKADLALATTRHELSSGSNIYLRVLRHPCAAGLLSFRITTDLIGSMLAEVSGSLRAVLPFGKELIVRHLRTQIYWLLVLVAWGATKLLATRGSARRPADAEQQDAWTFGQILPVVLLIAPIWSLVTAFAFSDRNEGIRHRAETHENPLMAVSAAAQTSSTPVHVTNFPTQSPVDSRSTRENQVDSSASFITNRYMSCNWIGCCLAFPCMAIMGVTCTQLIFAATLSGSPKSFWIDDMAAIFIILLAYPFAFHCSILIGLVYEDWLLGGQSTSSRSKTFRALLWLTVSIVWVFFILMWSFSRYAGMNGAKKFRYGGILGGTAVLHLVYALGYFLRAFRKPSRCFGN